MTCATSLRECETNEHHKLRRGALRTFLHAHNAWLTTCLPVVWLLTFHTYISCTICTSTQFTMGYSLTPSAGYEMIAPTSQAIPKLQRESATLQLPKPHPYSARNILQGVFRKTWEAPPRVQKVQAEFVNHLHAIDFTELTVGVDMRKSCSRRLLAVTLRSSRLLASSSLCTRSC